jgi:hypothetical protein
LEGGLEERSPRESGGLEGGLEERSPRESGGLERQESRIGKRLEEVRGLKRREERQED